MVFFVVSVHVDVGGVLIGRILQTYYVNDSFPVAQQLHDQVVVIVIVDAVAKLVPVWWRSFLELEKPASLNYSTLQALRGLPKLYLK